MDLEVLGGVGVGHLDALVEVVDEDDARLGAGRATVRMRSVCLVARTCRSSSTSTRSASSSEVVTSTAAASTSCSAWLSRSAATYAGSAVSSARIEDLGRPGLGVDADPALEQPLRGDRPDRAGTGRPGRRGARAPRRRRTWRSPGRRRRRRPRRRRAARTPPGSSGAGARRGPSAASTTARSTGRRRPGQGRRSSARSRPAARCRRARRGPTRSTGTLRCVTRAPAPSSVVASLLQLGRAGRPQPADRLLQPGPDVRVEAASSASCSASGGTRMSVCVTPSYCCDISRIASRPRVRTASQIACTAGIAASTSKSARGTASR